MEIIMEKRLENDAVLAVIDESKNVAADRWYIKLRFKTTIPWLPRMDDLVEREGIDLDIAKKELGELNFEVTKERNFVDQGEKEKVVEEIIADAYGNIGSYLASPEFVDKFCLKKIKELKDKMNSGLPYSVVEDTLEEDEGPVDFSDCFK